MKAASRGLDLDRALPILLPPTLRAELFATTVLLFLSRLGSWKERLLRALRAALDSSLLLVATVVRVKDVLPPPLLPWG